MDLSFKEKSIWVSMIVTIIVFGYYFARVFGVIGDTEIVRPHMLFIGIVIAMIILNILFNIILAIFNQKDAEDPSDERTKLIELKSIRVSYYIVSVGIVNIVILLLLGNSTFLITNLILGYFVVAQLASDIIQLIHYKCGV